MRIEILACKMCGKRFKVRLLGGHSTNGSLKREYFNNLGCINHKCYTCFRKNINSKWDEKKKAKRIVYEKTPKGFLMRAYRNMLNRVTGVQYKKAHLYFGKEILPKNDFYDWSLSDTQFKKLFKEWEGNSYNRKLTPSIDRVDPDEGYTPSNIRWLTHSENSSRHRKST